PDNDGRNRCSTQHQRNCPQTEDAHCLQGPAEPCPIVCPQQPKAFFPIDQCHTVLSDHRTAAAFSSSLPSRIPNPKLAETGYGLAYAIEQDKVFWHVVHGYPHYKYPPAD